MVTCNECEFVPDRVLLQQISVGVLLCGVRRQQQLCHGVGVLKYACTLIGSGVVADASLD